ncbi:SDR family NAD(P)-dependent oxidoreductase [bacterium SCSIO 12643]|nr:SDR family NAD(P)-dependent oxidoreductase [bacterium SCSIO 12643]
MNYYFITGTSSGIGKALTEALLKNNHTKVYGMSRRQDAVSGSYVPISIDLSKSDEIEAFQFPELADAERIVLINNAGQIGDIKPVGNVVNQAIADLFTVNVTAPGILMNKFIQAYGELPVQKTVLNVSSGAGKNAIEGWAAYCGSKAAIDLFSLTVFEEQKRATHPTQIYSIAPGVVDTQMQAEIRNSNETDFSRHTHFVNLKKNNELTSPDEVAEKYIYILNHTEKFPDCIFSLRDL